MLLARFTAPAAAFRWGWLAGWGFWLLSLGWLRRMGETRTSPAVALLAWAALSACLAVYTGAFTFCAARVLRRVPAGEALERGSRRSALARTTAALVLLPVLWVGFEYARAILFSGFPWNGLGVSQYRALPLIQVAEWGGVYAVSALVVFTNAAFALAVIRIAEARMGRRSRMPVPWEPAAAVLLLAVCAFGGKVRIKQYSARQARWPAVRVTAVQPNIPERDRYDTPFADLFSRLEALTLLGLVSGKPVDLVVWPETCMPSTVTDAVSQPGRKVRALSRVTAPILLGTMQNEPADGEREWYNTSILFDRDGRITGRYRKRHPIPFGEYPVLGFPFGGSGASRRTHLSIAAGRDATVFRIGDPDAAFGVLICFEDVMPYLARDLVRGGAQFLVNQTNDAWFDPSSESRQHMTHAVFRCIENRVPVVRAGNTGITCSIGATGAVDEMAGGGVRREGFHRATLRVRDRGLAPTFYTRFGDWPFAVPCAAIALLVLVGAGNSMRCKCVASLSRALPTKLPRKLAIKTDAPDPFRGFT